MAARTPASESDAEAMVSAVLTASRLLVAVSARSLAAVEDALTLPQFRMLVVLDTRGALSLSQLAAELGVQPSTAMRMLDRLEAVHMVMRGHQPTDRRTSVISLTATGRRTVHEATEHRRSQIAGIVDAMPPGQRRHLIRALQAFTEAGGEPSVTDGTQRHVGW
ncbi:MarR family winged helix-turn-helix transcriptional regulator [Actinacidiphila sp. bgisy160]|uniref:MarR family winged helix-turn-helix transcriptional regulator n=1 Tax=Actinacidiphila sp. bgisy160 TaxID=3413796 RepID=UPI003D717E35